MLDARYHYQTAASIQQHYHINAYSRLFVERYNKKDSPEKPGLPFFELYDFKNYSAS